MYFQVVPLIRTPDTHIQQYNRCLYFSIFVGVPHKAFYFFLQPWPLPHSPLLTLLLHQSSYSHQWPPVLGRCREKALASSLTINFFPAAYQTTTKSPLILYPKCYRPVCCLLLYCLLPNPKSQNRSLIRFFWINLYDWM